MTTAGIIIMAAMMGAMFLFGGHGKGHKHKEHASSEISVSSSAVTAAPAASAEEGKDAEHAH